MRDWYDNPHLEEIFDEQDAMLPRGPLGLLSPPVVTLLPGVDPSTVAVVKDYLAGNMGTMEFSSKMEALRLQALRQTLGK